ncbi:hypothetical protein [Nocardia heshunensis]
MFDPQGAVAQAHKKAVLFGKSFRLTRQLIVFNEGDFLMPGTGSAEPNDLTTPPKPGWPVERIQPQSEDQTPLTPSSATTNTRDMLEHNTLVRTMTEHVAPLTDTLVE